jgi:hypothetical protein
MVGYAPEVRKAPYWVVTPAKTGVQGYYSAGLSGFRLPPE